MMVLPLLGSCNELKDWRDSQIKTSHDLVNAGKVSPPATPINVPSKITSQLPWNSGFIVTAYTLGDEDVEIAVISPDDTRETCKWMLGKLAELGYDSADNPSRMLEGVDYHSPKTLYPRLYVKVTMNVHDQCFIEFKGYENDPKGGNPRQIRK